MATRTDLSSMSSKPSSASGGKPAGKGKGGGGFSISPRTMALAGVVLLMAIVAVWMNWTPSAPAAEVQADGQTPTTPGALGVPPGEPPVIPPAPAQPGTEGYSPS